MNNNADDDKSLTDFNNETIEKHNELRKLHGVAPLSVDWQLANSAQKYADKLAKENKFGHSDNKGEYGENLANSYNSTPGYVFSGAQATQNWYDEIKDYNFGQESQQTNKIGHFSQVVWKGTTHAGFGRSKSSGGTYIVVGQYKPPGNFLGKFKENVAPLTSHSSGSTKPAIQDSPTKKPAVPNDASKSGCCGGGGGGKKHNRNNNAAPVIGPRNQGDVMIKSNTKITKRNGNVESKEITETYKEPNGDTYELTKLVKSS